jgi:hypothetical protein
VTTDRIDYFSGCLAEKRSKRLVVKKLIDLKTLSEMIMVSVFTLRTYAKTGMPHYRVGKKILVDPDEFEIWFERHYKIVRNEQKSSLDQIVEDTLSEFGL